MTPIEREDIQATVAAGIISEGQAAQIIAVSEERDGIRSQLTGSDEPFELFKSFNEVFIIIGLVLLYIGWNGIALAFGSVDALIPSAIAPGVVSLLTLGLLARYFTLNRRMVGPSNAIVVMWTLSAMQLGTTLYARFLLDTIPPDSGNMAFYVSFTGVFVPMFVLAALLAFWYFFRIPSTLFAIALAIYVLVFAVTRASGQDIEGWRDIFLLSSEGPFSLITIALGLFGFLAAMYFDLKDPHRVTRHNKNAFWVHIIAAPAIVNTVALTLFTDGGTAAIAALIAFLLFITCLALIVDRRSFLLSGVIYIIALAFSIEEGSTFTTVFLLGAALVATGAFWAVLRSALLNTLPTFPFKDRLPPWAQKPA